MIRINLFKTEKKEVEQRAAPLEPVISVKKQPPRGPLVLLFIIIVIAALGVSQKRAIDREKRLLNAGKEEKKNLEPVLIKLDQVGQQKAFFERKIDLINELKAQQGRPVLIMEEISKDLPEWVWLTEATYSRQSVQIKGRALSNVLISDYIDNLEKSELFENVGLLSSVQKTQGGDLYLEFTLTVGFPPPAEPLRPLGSPAVKAKPPKAE
jgi:type IV pilus assembly protein PilN